MTTSESPSEVVEEPKPAFSVLAGTPVGDALRRHWIPVLPVDVLNRQHARRVRLLGEDLVCYRDRVGRYGLIGDRCPHRGVSLEWGVAADVGLRCPYHGWCFDESGHCVDIPLEGLITRDYVQIPAHPVTEHGGMLWAFLGAGEPPAFPDLGALGDPTVLRHLRFVVTPRNWLEVIEDREELDGVPAEASSPYAFLGTGATSEVEVMVIPLDDASSMLVAGDRLGPLPAGLQAASPASDLSDGEVGALPEATVPAAAEQPGPFARRWLARTLDLALDDDSPALAGAPEVADFLVDAAAVGEGGGPVADLAVVIGAVSAPATGHQLDPAIAGALSGRLAEEGPTTRWWSLDLLVRGHLPIWLEAIGAADAAATLRAGPALNDGDAASAALASTAEAEKLAVEAFENAFLETQREPWKLAWPYVWNAESSARWARGRDHAVAEAWRRAWSTASRALHAGGTPELATAGFGAADAVAAHALGVSELAARALCWPSCWAETWAETVAAVREAAIEEPEGEGPDAVLSGVTAALVAVTLGALGAAN